MTYIYPMMLTRAGGAVWPVFGGDLYGMASCPPGAASTVACRAAMAGAAPGLGDRPASLVFPKGPAANAPVSYTHLTLPTKRIV